MKRIWLVAAIATAYLAAGCSTVGVGREGGFAEVRPTVAQQMLLDNRNIIVFDVRSESEYAGSMGHIAGAQSLPLESIETRLMELVPYQSGTVMVYGDTEEESRSAARILVAAGFQNVVRIRGGIRSWIDLGYKTVLSP